MVPINDLAFGWFTVFVILLMGYSILDGFDLGVGMLHLFPRKDEERRLMLNSIGPVWDGNEVWLVTAGGALFAGFPDIYATMLSAFYTPVMILLAGLIFRAVAIEFRSKQAMPWWRWTWDFIFFLGSLLISFVLGLTIGNLIRGIPVDVHKEFTGTLETILHPYAFLVGVLTVSLFLMHGSIYILMKTEGEFHDKMRRWTNPCIIFFIIMYAVTTMATLIYMPHMIQALHDRPIFFLVAIVNILVVANIPREIHHGRDVRAFVSSSMNMLCLLTLYAIGTYPNVIRSLDNPDLLSLTIYNSPSSEKTLEILFLIALIGFPLVISYTIGVYYIFRGKVRLDPHSY
jgi:cytochrome d ubiquinol oxidase subunit II